MSIAIRQITGSRPGPRLLITGGVHGDEFEPMAAIRQLLSEVDAALLRGRLTLIPVANEAAFLRGARCAEDGLDLARTCPGKVDGSPTERIAHTLSQQIRAADYYIDLHTGGNVMDVWPLVGYKLVGNPTTLQQQRQMAAAFNLPLVWGTDARLNGRTLSVARDAGIPAIYAEYMGSGRCDPEGVAAYVDGCLNVMGALKMLNRQPPMSEIQQVVEDHRESAGHMQICNLAPATGLFEPEVRLGGRIQAGQSLGTISDGLGEQVVRVDSQQTGQVIVLRTFSRVHQQDPLAVILEDDVDRLDPISFAN